MTFERKIEKATFEILSGSFKAARSAPESGQDDHLREDGGGSRNDVLILPRKGMGPRVRGAAKAHVSHADILSASHPSLCATYSTPHHTPRTHTPRQAHKTAHDPTLRVGKAHLQGSIKPLTTSHNISYV